MRYKKLQKIGICTTVSVAQEIFFLKEGENLLQQVTIRYKMLQKQHSQKTSLKVAQKLFFF